MSVLFASLMGGVSIIWDREFGFLKEILIALSAAFCITRESNRRRYNSNDTGILIMIIARIIGSIMYPSGSPGRYWHHVHLRDRLYWSWDSDRSKIESHEGFQMVMSFLTMPLVLLSGAFFPIANLPGG